jgi:SIR2-like domain
MDFDPVREATELRNQLSSDKRRLAFFFGAGASQAVGIPGLQSLTKMVNTDLDKSHGVHFARLLNRDKDGTLETVLNRVRLCREMLGNDAAGEVEGLSTSEAASLDRAICRAIRARVGMKPPKGLKTHYIFAHWAKTITRTFPLEIFTTNYDLLFEMAMESAETPYFDGFIGSVSPFFRATTIDADFGGVPIPSVPRDWVRLWKLHGSIGWVISKDDLTNSERIVRRGDFEPTEEDELMVFPSRQKYTDSRRLPFLAYQDRLRRLLASGETLLVTCGYSYADEHLNEIIFQSLRSNPRLAVTALCFGSLESEALTKNLLRPTDGITNLTIYGSDAAVVGGRKAPWSAPSSGPKGDLSGWPFWDQKESAFRLGDFNFFVEFLRSFLGGRGLHLPSTELGQNAH